jgi:hypothetical protein
VGDAHSECAKRCDCRAHMRRCAGGRVRLRVSATCLCALTLCSENLIGDGGVAKAPRSASDDTVGVALDRARESESGEKREREREIGHRGEMEDATGPPCGERCISRRVRGATLSRNVRS